MPDRIVRAGEIGQYAYCAKAWWLGAIDGVKPVNVRELESGAALHARHGRTVVAAGWAQRAAIGLMLIGAVLGLVWFMSGLG
jgi:hypothetical protein